MRGWWFRERGKQGNGTLFNDVKPCPFSDPFPFPGTRSTDSGHMNVGHMIAHLKVTGSLPPIKHPRMPVAWVQYTHSIRGFVIISRPAQC
jgi:hypothetical protein